MGLDLQENLSKDGSKIAQSGHTDVSQSNDLFGLLVWEKEDWATGCDTVGRAVASDTRNPRFESCHRQNLYVHFQLFWNCLEKTTVNQKEAGNAHFLILKNRKVGEDFPRSGNCFFSVECTFTFTALQSMWQITPTKTIDQHYYRRSRGCGSVGGEVASNTRDLQFKSRH